MLRPLIFVGSRNDIAGVAQIAEFSGVEILGILDYHYYGNTDSMSNIPVIGDERWLLDSDNKQAKQWLQTCDFFPVNWWEGNQPVAGHLDLQELRRQRISILEQSGATVTNLFHPGAKIDGLRSKVTYNFKLGRGILIDDNCWISPNEVCISDYCQFSIGVNIGHHTQLGRNTTVAPWTTLTRHHIGSDCFIGMHSKTDMVGVFKYGIMETGDNVTVWANSLIGKPTPSDHIYTNTNRILKKFKGKV